MKAVVAAFNQEKALVGAFSVITNLRMDLFEALVSHTLVLLCLHCNAQNPSQQTEHVRHGARAASASAPRSAAHPRHRHITYSTLLRADGCSPGYYCAIWYKPRLSSLQCLKTFLSVFLLWSICGNRSLVLLLIISLNTLGLISSN